MLVDLICDNGTEFNFLYPKMQQQQYKILDLGFTNTIRWSTTVVVSYASTDTVRCKLVAVTVEIQPSGRFARRQTNTLKSWERVKCCGDSANYPPIN